MNVLPALNQTRKSHSTKSFAFYIYQEKERKCKWIVSSKAQKLFKNSKMFVPIWKNAQSGTPKSTYLPVRTGKRVCP
jgi:3-methyladenine DNA glycosylase AlkC